MMNKQLEISTILTVTCISYCQLLKVLGSNSNNNSFCNTVSSEFLAECFIICDRLWPHTVLVFLPFQLLFLINLY